MDGSSGDGYRKEPNKRCMMPYRDIFNETSPRSPLSTTHSPGSASFDLPMNGAANTSIEHLYNNVCEIQSSDHSLSRRSFFSYGEESRIDSELRYYAGVVECGRTETTKEETNKKTHLSSPRPVISSVQEESPKPKPSPRNRPPMSKQNGKSLKRQNLRLPENNGNEDRPKAGYLGSYLLKQATDLVSAGDDCRKALELALRAMKSFENSGNSNLEVVMCLHVVAASFCKLGQYSEAIPVLERSIEIPVMGEDPDHSLAKFAGCMQLGDTYAMLGQIENSILCYTAGLEIQRQALEEKDPRVAATCRYVAEAHVQALQFDEAEKLCNLALNIHKENGFSASTEEAADRRLMGLICDSKGDYESALEHYVLASMAMSTNDQEPDVAYIDCNIGDTYLSLSRYDEALFAYQKALTVFKSTGGENHPSVASVFVRMANLYNKIGKFRESKTYCENALRIYTKPNPETNQEEAAGGLIEVSAIYESMNEVEKALKLLQKASKVYGNAPGHQSTIAGIEAQMGVLYYLMGIYSESYLSFEKAISKLRAVAEKKSALFGVALNQMGLVCIQLYAIKEAADLFEEARIVLEAECGPYHPDTLGVYSNLAGTYDAMGRTIDAIEILEYVVGIREEKLGTANPDVFEEKRRLAELLKEAGRARSRKARSLETLFNTHSQTTTNSERR